MIYTSNHKNFDGSIYKTCAISGNKGKDANYVGKSYSKLAPKLSFWKVWHDNIGVIPEEENIKYYIKEYYLQVLKNLNPEDIYKELNNSVLLCYEESNQFCHRHIVAEWFKLLLNVDVTEINIVNGSIKEVQRPDYIGKYLEEIMKKNTNMKNFNSLRALYLFEKGNELDSKADSLDENESVAYNNYKQVAAYYRSEADEAESEYINEHFQKTKK